MAATYIHMDTLSVEVESIRSFSTAKDFIAYGIANDWYMQYKPEQREQMLATMWKMAQPAKEKLKTKEVTPEAPPEV
jgi:hypothetical protein